MYAKFQIESLLSFEKFYSDATADQLIKQCVIVIAETIMTANSLQIRNGAISRERLITLSDRLRIANLHKKELNFKLVVIGDFGVGK